jgi:hypothetical protein
MITVSPAVLALALTAQAPMNVVAVKPDQPSSLREVSPVDFESDVRSHRPRLTDDMVAKTAAGAHLFQKRSRLKKWLPWVGAVVGGALLGVGVAGEEDLVPSGKVMWVGIGAAAGAGVGWVIAHIADR